MLLPDHEDAFWCAGRVQCKRQWYQVQADGHIATVDTLEDPDLKPKLPGSFVESLLLQGPYNPPPSPPHTHIYQ